MIICQKALQNTDSLCIHQLFFLFIKKYLEHGDKLVWKVGGQKIAFLGNHCRNAGSEYNNKLSEFNENVVSKLWSQVCIVYKYIYNKQVLD